MNYPFLLGLFFLSLAHSAESAGPSGLGSLKIGMTKEAIEALQASDGAYLSEPMVKYVPQHHPLIAKYRPPIPEGVDQYKVSIVSPLSDLPLKSELTLDHGKLSHLNVIIEESSDPLLFDKIKKQVAEKYGTGTQEDTRKEEQCIYKNGANFKVMSGQITTRWIEKLSPTQTIHTSLIETLIESCPTSLRYGRDQIKSKNLSIRLVDSEAEAKAKKNDQPNLF